MTIQEPMTVLTDYLLGAVAAWFSFLLCREREQSRRFWALAFAGLAVAAFLGGTWHGFVQSDLLWKATTLTAGVASFAMVTGSSYAVLSGRPLVLLITLALAIGAFLGGTWHGFVQSDLLWRTTTLSLGVASFAMVMGSSYAVLSGSRRVLLITLALAKLTVYLIWMLFHHQFIYVVIDTGIAFVVVAALHLWKWNGLMLAGVAVSIIAGVVQASGFQLHAHFNHNDLYHVIQIGALVLLYRGARRLQSS